MLLSSTLSNSAFITFPLAFRLTPNKQIFVLNNLFDNFYQTNLLFPKFKMENLACFIGKHNSGAEELTFGQDKPMAKQEYIMSFNKQVTN